MIKGLYTAASGMMAQMAKQEVTANNIANVNTCGFKKDELCTRSFPNMLISRLGETRINSNNIKEKAQPTVIGSLGTGVVVDAIYTNNEMGTLEKTDNPLDLAISNSSYYFTVQTPEGSRYTRDGRFKLDGQKLLVNYAGQPVLDYNDEPISLEDVPLDEGLRINNYGQIFAGEEYITTLKTVTFADLDALQKNGGLLFNTDQEPLSWEDAGDDPGILQGYMEISNVNAVQEMVSLITVMRTYESCQRVVQAEDDMLQKAINEVGRVS